MTTLNLSSFSIKTPSNGGDYQFSLQGTTVSANGLKFGVVKLFKELGVYEIPEILKTIKACPESYAKKLLLNILDNGSIPDVAQLPPETPVLSPDKPGSPDIPPAIHQDSLPVVTLNSVPLKPRSLSRGQLTLEDPFILATVADALAPGRSPRERSYRFIAGELAKQGIKVSHMTVKRRMKFWIEQIKGVRC